MRKLVALITAIAVIASLSACSQSQTSDVSTESQNTSSSEEAATGSFATNPVKVDENGNVDMKVALAYQTDFDALLKKLEAKTPDGNTLVSENSNEKTKELFNYLKECYGKVVLSGQQYSDDKQLEDIAYYNATGDLPAIKGFDFLFAVGGNATNDKHIEDAIEWHNNMNGIVAFCWHWKVPIDIDAENNQNSIAFYSDEIKNFSLKNAVTPGTKEYEVVIRDIDTVALKLQVLEKAGVPVLWRPLHEASGAWFWWGVKDKEIASNQYYQKLWYMIYDRLENYHKLTNLIWVWNGQAKKAAVNENTFDIAGIDVYPNSENHSEQSASYETLDKLVASDKMLALSECGYVPDPDLIFAADSKVKWLYFMPWNGEFVYSDVKLGGTPVINPARMSEEFIQKVYASDKVVTLSELPDLDKNGIKQFSNHIEMWMITNGRVRPANDKLKDFKTLILKENKE